MDILGRQKREGDGDNDEAFIEGPMPFVRQTRSSSTCNLLIVYFGYSKVLKMRAETEFARAPTHSPRTSYPLNDSP